ncbi:hypothetical protein LROSRS0_0927 [Furfurilactobacillus rossiae]|nr:hypothetical protein LROSRS0_0927 [Furfurilactobacillus rossiae]
MVYKNSKQITPVEFLFKKATQNMIALYTTRYILIYLDDNIISGLKYKYVCSFKKTILPLKQVFVLNMPSKILFQDYPYLIIRYLSNQQNY